MSLADARACDEAFATLPVRYLLPRPEPKRQTRARMADIIGRLVSLNGNVTREDMERAGFTGAQLDGLFHAACRVAQAGRMVA